jgi:hypothetical protein
VARRTPVAVTAVVGLVCLPLATAYGVGAFVVADDDAGGDFGLVPSDAVGANGGEVVPDDYGGDGVPPELQPGGSVDVVCTDLVDSSVGSSWQDVDGAIHVVIVVDNACGTGQRLDDPAAGFTLTMGGADIAAASFDFASDPLDVPAYGSSDAELVFGPDTFVDLAALETAGLGGDAGVSAAAPTGFGLRYSYVCTDAPAAVASSATTPLTGLATAEPILPEPAGGDALAQLDAIAAADREFVDAAVLDRWVPQISSKKPDVVLPDGSTWDAASILADHRDWRVAYPRVRLLWSGDYSTYTYPDYWVTIVAVPFATADEANAWCDANGLPLEDCYAKLVSRTAPQEGSTRLRP